MKNKDDLENLIRKLQYEASLPEVDFEIRLKKKLLRYNSPRSFFDKVGHLFRNYDLNYNLAFNLLIIIFILGFGFLLVKNFDLIDVIPRNTQKNTTFATKENLAIVTNVINNNPLLLLNETENDPQQFYKTTSNEDLASSSTIKNSTDNNLFYMIQIETVPGARSSDCFVDPLIKKTNIISTYKTNDQTNFYFKSIETDNENNVLSYFLTDNTRQISYIGDSIAVEQTLNDKADPDITISLSPTPQVITKIDQGSLFTDSIINIENDFSTDNTNYILITQNENINFCSISNSGPVISIITIDPMNNFQIVSKAFYFGTPTSYNLIYTNFFIITSQSLPEEEAIKKFRYELDIPLFNKEVISTPEIKKTFLP